VPHAHECGELPLESIEELPLRGDPGGIQRFKDVGLLLVADDRLADGRSAAAAALAAIRTAVRRGRLPAARAEEALGRIDALRARIAP